MTIQTLIQLGVPTKMHLFIKQSTFMIAMTKNRICATMGSAYCHTAWEKVYMYKAAPYNAYALIHRSNGTEATCNCKGGNKSVDRGQHSCYTPLIWDRDPYQSWGYGQIGG
jgi:hypothetical protein